jgi:hypothetical protein
MDEAVFNGIDGSNGEYLLPAMTPLELSKIAQGERIDAQSLKELRWRHEQTTAEHLAVREGVNPRNLNEAGWGVIFARDSEPGVKEALAELLRHRREQVTRSNEQYFKEFDGVKGYVAGESKAQFLARHGAGPGPVDPRVVPYYLLLVGDPQSIPFRFQYQLDVQYAVGRIHFNTLDEYAQYARSVVKAETERQSSRKRITFFGVRNGADRATQMSADNLVEPLAKNIVETQKQWDVKTYLGTEATKSRLASLFVGGEDTPSLLFTASHGVGFPLGDPRQLPHQGALLCQEWPGPLGHRGPIPVDYYLSAEDITDQAQLSPVISFHFACYGAGTPHLDDFAHQAFQKQTAIAPIGFVSRLSQRLLSHPKGGTLAFVGHVDRAWGYSFLWPRSGKQLSVFESTLSSIMEGNPVGLAMEYFNERYAELSSDLSTELEELKFGRRRDDLELAGMWTANNDARSYVIIGDPAVRLHN